MRYVLYALIAGAVSAFGFEPVGWWPLLLVAFAALCELLDRTKSLRRSLLLGWAFGFGQFVVGLNWIATAFTYQSNMPAWLGWVAVVLLSLYLAVYPAIATGLAWRFGRDDRVVLVMRPRRRLGDHRMAARNDVHRLPVEPRRRRAGADAADRHHAADRHLRAVGPRRPARRRDLARILPQVAAAGRHPRRHRLPVAAPVLAGARPTR